MDNKNLSIIIVAFVALILGAGLISIIASQEQVLTTKTLVSNETLDIASARDEYSINTTVGYQFQPEYYTKASSGCDIDNFVISNYTGTAATVDTDYVFYSTNGTLNLLNTTVWQCQPEADGGYCNDSWDNTTLLTYEYCADDYLRSSWQRSILNVVVGFFALMLLAIGLGIFYNILKNEGLLNI